ncbi:MAG: hypothetical protein AAGG68_10205 [Bacteroidota bacterium]
MSKKKSNLKSPKVNEELKEFDIQINEFGEISSTLNVDKINAFLNKNVEDKKLKEAAEKEKEEES